MPIINRKVIISSIKIIITITNIWVIIFNKWCFIFDIVEPQQLPFDSHIIIFLNAFASLVILFTKFGFVNLFVIIAESSLAGIMLGRFIYLLKLFRMIQNVPCHVTNQQGKLKFLLGWLGSQCLSLWIDVFGTLHGNILIQQPSRYFWLL